jgi:hypothetical protein
LLGHAGAVWTHGHISLSQYGDFPNWRGQAPVFIPQGTGRPWYTPGHWFHASQGYDGGILTRLHTGTDTKMAVELKCGVWMWTGFLGFRLESSGSECWQDHANARNVSQQSPSVIFPRTLPYLSCNKTNSAPRAVCHSKNHFL